MNVDKWCQAMGTRGAVLGDGLERKLGLLSVGEPREGQGRGRFRVGTRAKVNASAPTLREKLWKGRFWLQELCLPRITPVTGSGSFYSTLYSALPSSSASQETVTRGMKTLTSSAPTAPLVSTTIHTTPAAASRARATMGSAALSCPRQRRWCAITVPRASPVRPPAYCLCATNSHEWLLVYTVSREF